MKFGAGSLPIGCLGETLPERAPMEGYESDGLDGLSILFISYGTKIGTDGFHFKPNPILLREDPTFILPAESPSHRIHDLTALQDVNNPTFRILFQV